LPRSAFVSPSETTADETLAMTVLRCGAGRWLSTASIFVLIFIGRAAVSKTITIKITNTIATKTWGGVFVVIHLRSLRRGYGQLTYSSVQGRFTSDKGNQILVEAKEPRD